MLLHELDATRVSPARPIRVLVEDPAVCSIAPELDAPSGVEVTLCSGPRTAGEPCPLVLDGRCPAGRPDVVVCAIDGPWARSVRAAWALEGVPVVDAAPGQPLADGLRRALGIALGARWPTAE